MSLNGLDDPKVREAHEAAVAEPGGWFLLKYAARDEVDLLGRGNGGIVEIRNNIAQYEETSPLFGFLRYRRRNVIIKYMPDDCSRLVQARLSVHFNAICERFTPYNTTFSISTAKELKDTKLSAACSLHAASGSTSSSTSSLRRRRLMEIAEEEEEEQRAVKRSSTVLEDDDGDSDTDRPRSLDSPPPVTLNADLAAQPEESKFSPSVDPPDFVGVDRPSSPGAYDEEGRRLSSQTARPDLYSYNSYPYGKPKVKLGPRPSLEVSGRPKTAAGAGTFRPVAQMPSGLKMYSKGSKRVKAADDGDVAEPHDPTEVAFPIVNKTTIDHPSSSLLPDDGSVKSPTSPVRPATSSGVSIKSPVVTTFPTIVKNTMTPEKARLMRAMQLREKKKQASLLPPAAPAAEGSNQDEHAEHRQQSPETDESTTGLPTLDEEEERRRSMAKQDSGVVVDSATEASQADHSDAAQSDSRPESPLAPSSEHEQSTKASSLSEATDETVKSPTADESEEALPAGEDDTTVLEESITITKVDAKEETEQEQEGEHEQEQSTQVAGSEPGSAAEPFEDSSSPNKDGPAVLEPNDQVENEKADSTEETAAATSSSKDEPQNEKPAEELVAPSVQGTPQEPEQSPDAAAGDLPEPPLTPPVSKSMSDPSMTPSKMVLDAEESASPEAVATSPHGIPTSKFSTSSPVGVPTIVPPVEESLSSTTEESSQKQKRRSIEPIRTDLHDKPSDNLSDDDDLMDELQSATVQQAQPMTVSKSPVSPMFPSPTQPEGGEKVSPRVVRTISNPVRGNLLTPTDTIQSSARSVSTGAAYLHKITQQQTSSRENLLPKTGKLGSRISQRIKALEMLSVNTPGDVPSRSNSTRSVAPSATFFSVGKGRDPSRSPSVAERATSLSRRSPQRSQTAISDSRDGSPEFKSQRERSLSVASRLSMFEAPPIPSPNSMPRGRPETISVTARILRDPSEVGLQPEVPKDPSEFSRLELRQSPLEVNHQRADAEQASPPKQTIQERRMSREKRRSQTEDKDEEEDAKARRSSLSIVRDFIKDRRRSLSSAPPDVLTAPSVMSPKTSPSRPPSTHTNGGFSRRLSISSRRSSISKDAALSPSSVTEASSGDDSRSTKSDKKKGRAGRFMRRLSSSISSSLGKNMTPTAISPTVKEEDLTELREPHPAQPTVQYMGDVNVQFPDNLLWKRRTLGLDSQGFLILTASNMTSKDKPAIGVKRYHLSDFRTPFAPDVEVQELPNSVVLDFIEGSGLQMACEDRAGQMELLQTLLEAHQSHTEFGQ